MKTAIAFALILSAATAVAETKIIEYPDHYYAESTGSPVAKPASSTDSVATAASGSPSDDYQRITSHRAGGPVTNFDISAKPTDPAEARNEIKNEIQRLQKQHSELLSPQSAVTSEQAADRQNKAASVVRKINRLTTELVKHGNSGQWPE